ncbi:MAG: hypothetical protein KIS63_06605 [Caldilineales bacterium]|nr:hypothetical protein [Caldilineales bacterium]
MADNKVSSLPVMVDGHLAGIITQTDLFRLAVEAMGARQRGVRVTLLVPEMRGMLADLTNAITNAGGIFISMVTVGTPDPDTELVMMKIRDMTQRGRRHPLRPQRRSHGHPHDVSDGFRISQSESAFLPLRFLCLSHPFPGHLDWGGYLATAAALARRGHEVLWASAARRVAASVVAAGVRFSSPLPPPAGTATYRPCRRILPGPKNEQVRREAWAGGVAANRGGGAGVGCIQRRGGWLPPRRRPDRAVRGCGRAPGRKSRAAAGGDRPSGPPPSRRSRPPSRRSRPPSRRSRPPGRYSRPGRRGHRPAARDGRGRGRLLGPGARDAFFTPPASRFLLPRVVCRPDGGGRADGFLRRFGVGVSRAGIRAASGADHPGFDLQP